MGNLYYFFVQGVTIMGMKKTALLAAVLLAACTACPLPAAMPASAYEAGAGDADGNGSIDRNDALCLRE